MPLKKEYHSIQHSINFISEPYSVSSQSHAEAKKTLTLQKNLWNEKHNHNAKAMHDDEDGNDDTKRKISYESEMTLSSAFTTTCIKLKGYLKNLTIAKATSKIIIRH